MERVSCVLISAALWAQFRSVALLIGLALFFFGPGVAGLRAANDPRSSAEHFEVWHNERDWLNNSVTAILQTHDGYLWLGSYHGLVRFDGVSFTVFDSGNAPELPNGRITINHLMHTHSRKVEPQSPRRNHRHLPLIIPTVLE